VKALRCGGERWEPVVRRTGEAFEVELAGRVYRFDLLEEGPGVFVFRDDRRTSPGTGRSGTSRRSARAPEQPAARTRAPWRRPCRAAWQPCGSRRASA
jgi:hypothetical protein